MKRIIFSLLFILFGVTAAFAQQDAEGCKDSPLFPKRMPNYFISECKSNFDAAEFYIKPDFSDPEVKEGTMTLIRYDFNPESNQQKPSALQILKNYENASKSIGGVTVLQNGIQGIATYKIVKNGQVTAWIKVEGGGNDNTDFYILTIVQLEQMKQEVTADDILTALNNDGHIALYINFETGKSTIKPESQKIIDEIAAMLSNNPALKVSIEGHTDNVGNAASNQTLSENRATSVLNALTAKNIDKTRLTAKGWGQTKPIDDNTTDEGKAKNRRVEIVKL
ncbi:OmpA family protein [Solitalea longa]|uniref:OmpA family protein n=1 Tax=Solitalea longa TaxID=2079460 RepID=A0A2S4ZYD6_9SPHI|nr:OmpA family protein [Solitalea longa]POY35296.1 OmpA family protein [Solitalea longa]